MLVRLGGLPCSTWWYGKGSGYKLMAYAFRESRIDLTCKRTSSVSGWLSGIKQAAETDCKFSQCDSRQGCTFKTVVNYNVDLTVHKSTVCTCASPSMSITIPRIVIQGSIQVNIHCNNAIFARNKNKRESELKQGTLEDSVLDPGPLGTVTSGLPGSGSAIICYGSGSRTLQEKQYIPPVCHTHTHTHDMHAETALGRPPPPPEFHLQLLKSLIEL
jgi:hypothetical protein